MMFPRPLTAPEPAQAEPEDVRPAAGQMSALFAAIKAERAKRLAAQPAAAAPPRPLRNWEIVGMIALALALAHHFLPAREPAPAASQPKAATATVADLGYGCPDMDDTRQAERLAIGGDIPAMSALLAVRNCVPFLKGDSVIVSQRLGSYRLVRRPAGWRRYWIDGAYLEPAP